MASNSLAGSRILVVEDEYFLADDARSTLSRLGAEVVGPAPTVAEASALIETGGQIDCALLDVNLRGETAFDVADALQQRGIPFAFVTGYDRDTIPERFSGIPYLAKPVRSKQVVELFEQLGGGPRNAL